MLGLGEADKTETLIRLGWANDPEGARKLANFVFTQGVMVEAPIDSALPQAQLEMMPPKTTKKGELAPVA